MTPAQARAFILRDYIVRQRGVTLRDALPPSKRIRAVHPEQGAML